MNPLPEISSSDLAAVVKQGVELDRRRRSTTKIWVSVAVPILAALVGWVLIDQRSLEHRLTKTEERLEGVRDDLTEIKADLKKLLEHRR